MNKHKSQFNNCVQALFKGGEKGGYYSYGEITEVVDYIGEGNARVQEGAYYQFDGVNDFVNFTAVSYNSSSPLWKFANATTAELEFNFLLTNNTNVNQTFFEFTSSTGQTLLRVEYSGTVDLVYYKGTSPLVVINSSAGITSNVWYNCRFVIESGTVAFYLNGSAEYVGEPYDADFSSTTSYLFNLGSKNESLVRSNYLQGGLYDFSLKADGRYVVYYPMNERGGDRCTNIIHDSFYSPNLNGIITNTLLSSFHQTTGNEYGSDVANRFGHVPTILFRRASAQILTVPHNNTQENFTDWNIELFYMPLAVPPGGATHQLLTKRNSSSAGFSPFDLHYRSTQRFWLLSSYTNSAWNVNLQASISTPPNQMYHVAYSKEGNTFRIFVNGVLAGTQVVAGTYTTYYHNVPMYIGRHLSGSFNFSSDGYIGMIKIDRVAIRTGTFTVPTAKELESQITANTILCLRGIRDDISMYGKWNNARMTTGNNPVNAILTSNPPQDNIATGGSFRAPSFYGDRIKYNAKLIQSNALSFDGVDDFIQLQDSSDFDFGTGDFTIDFWVNPSTFTTVSGNDRGIFDARTGAGNYEVYVNSANNNIGFYSGFTQSQPATTMNPNQWYHVAFVREAGVIRTFYDFVLVNTTVDANSINCNINPFLGARDGSFCFQGSLANFRITKGTALNVSQLKDYTTLHPNTVLFFPLQEGAGNRIFSRVGGHVGTMNNFNLGICWTLQDVVHSNLLQGFDSLTSGEGTGYYTTASSPLYNIQGDWAVDFWINTTQANTFIVNQFSPPPYSGWLIGLGQFTAGRLTLRVFQSNTQLVGIQSTSIVNTGQWVHCAISKAGTNIRLYINGVQEAAAISNGFDTTANLTLFTNPDPLGAQRFNGHIANLRIWKKDKFPTAFTPPTTNADYEDRVNLSLYLKGTEDLINNAPLIQVGSGVKLCRKPLTTTNPQTGVSGGSWHNGAETKFRNYLAPELIKAETSGIYFNAGNALDVDYTVIETDKIKNTRQPDKLANIRLYTNTGEK